MASSKLPSGICKIAGKVAIIAGGASGLGRGTAERFVRSGAKVVIADLPTSSGAELAASLGADNALFVPTDVTQDPDVRNALEMTKEKFGRLDIGVNAAAVRETVRVCQDHGDLETFKRVVDANLCGAFNVVRLSSALMNENDPDGDWQKGIFINATSDAASLRHPDFVALGAAHGAVHAMTLMLARDLATIGVRAVTIAPGMFGSSLEDAFSAAPWDAFADEFARVAENVIENPMINGTIIKLQGRSSSQALSASRAQASS